MEPERQQFDRSGGGRVAVVRGVLVVVAALAVGAFVVTQGLDDPDTTSIAAASDVAVGGEPTSDADDAAVAGAQVGADGEPLGLDGADDPNGVDPSGAMASDDNAMVEEAGDGAGTEPTAGEEAGPAEADPAATVLPPAEVTVLVLNGSGGKGIAGRGSAILQEQGYDVLAPKNADFLGPSLVLYTDGFAEEAQAVAQAFGVDAAAVVAPLDPADTPINDTQSADIVVVVGEDGLINV